MLQILLLLFWQHIIYVASGIFQNTFVVANCIFLCVCSVMGAHIFVMAWMYLKIKLVNTCLCRWFLQFYYSIHHNTASCQTVATAILSGTTFMSCKWVHSETRFKIWLHKRVIEEGTKLGFWYTVHGISEIKFLFNLKRRRVGLRNVAQEQNELQSCVSNTVTVSCYLLLFFFRRDYRN